MIMIVSKSSIKNIMLIFSFWLKNKGVVVQATSKDNTKVLFFYSNSFHLQGAVDRWRPMLMTYLNPYWTMDLQ